MPNVQTNIVGDGVKINLNLERKQKVTKTKKSMIITITFIGATVGPAVGLRLGLEVVGGTLTKKNGS